MKHPTPWSPTPSSARFAHQITYALIAAAALGCSSGDTGTAPPVSVAVDNVVVTGPQSMIVGEARQFAATVRDHSGAPLDRAVSWSISSASVASVSPSGLVTAVSPGTVSVIAASEGKGGSIEVTVLPIPVSTVDVAPPNLTLTAGASQQLTITLKDLSGSPLLNRSVTFSSSNTTVANVSPQGVVTAVSPGTATVTAGSEGKTGSSIVTVVPVPVATVNLLPASLSMVVGATKQLAVTLKDSAGTILTGRVVAFSSGNGSIVSVTNAGLLTALSTGTTTVSATSEGKLATVVVVVIPVPVFTVDVTPASASLLVGSNQQLTVTLKDSTGATLSGRTVAFSTANASVATISASGLVTAVSPGSTTVTASSEGKAGVATIAVRTVPAATVDIAPRVALLTLGSALQLATTARAADGTVIVSPSVAYTSSNLAVATVNASGLVTPMGVDTVPVVITVTIDGKSAAARIRVANAGPANDNVLIEVRDTATGLGVAGAAIDAETTDAVVFGGISFPNGVRFTGIGTTQPSRGVYSFLLPVANWRFTARATGYQATVSPLTRVDQGLVSKIVIEVARTVIPPSPTPNISIQSIRDSAGNNIGGSDSIRVNRVTINVNTTAGTASNVERINVTFTNLSSLVETQVCTVTFSPPLTSSQSVRSTSCIVDLSAFSNGAYRITANTFRFAADTSPGAAASVVRTIAR